jgi:hypothetical protein
MGRMKESFDQVVQAKFDGFQIKPYSFFPLSNITQATLASRNFQMKQMTSWS